MSNPWLKRNPFMSMWLSWANWMIGTMRGQASAQARRQFNTALTKATNENLKALLGGTAPAVTKAKPKRRR